MTLAAAHTPITDFIVKLSIPVLAGLGLGGVVGMFAWLLTPGYWALIGLVRRRTIAHIERGDVAVWSLWGGFLGAIGLGLLWILEYKRLL